jgi:hypothetical protein
MRRVLRVGRRGTVAGLRQRHVRVWPPNSENVTPSDQSVTGLSLTQTKDWLLICRRHGGGTVVRSSYRSHRRDRRTQRRAPLRATHATAGAQVCEGACGMSGASGRRAYIAAHVVRAWNGGKNGDLRFTKPDPTQGTERRKAARVCDSRRLFVASERFVGKLGHDLHWFWPAMFPSGEYGPLPSPLL